MCNDKFRGHDAALVLIESGHKAKDSKLISLAPGCLPMLDATSDVSIGPSAQTPCSFQRGSSPNFPIPLKKERPSTATLKFRDPHTNKTPPPSPLIYRPQNHHRSLS
ncbi:hypothetical protein N431DRAFT_100041 [Stipitochalara longipes BDJ]|nr:hypothetical protein N431DRAFT_100041 [Stipitochalara longipes BDJ]